MPPILATDLDGTLIPGDDLLPDDPQLQALERLQQLIAAQQLEVVFVTGRHLKSVVEVIRFRANEKMTVTRSFYITSHSPKAKHLASRIRDHWRIENELHYVLDVAFGEDRRTIRSEYGAQNFALVCRHALCLIKNDPRKKSVAMKKRIASWGPKGALEFLFGGFHAV